MSSYHEQRRQLQRTLGRLQTLRAERGDAARREQIDEQIRRAEQDADRHLQAAGRAAVDVLRTRVAALADDHPDVSGWQYVAQCPSAVSYSGPQGADRPHASDLRAEQLVADVPALILCAGLDLDPNRTRTFSVTLTASGMRLGTVFA